jgi:hypothetical protein
MFLAFMREKGGYTMTGPSWRWWIALDFWKYMGSSVAVVGDINGCFFVSSAALVVRVASGSSFNDINFFFGHCIPSGFT